MDDEIYPGHKAMDWSKIYFRKYMHRMGKTASPYFLYEEGEIIDDAEHTVFQCSGWQSYRFELTSAIGTITAANIVGVMIASRVHRFIRRNRL